jgi:hypothetical protein
MAAYSLNQAANVLLQNGGGGSLYNKGEPKIIRWNPFKCSMKLVFLLDN